MQNLTKFRFVLLTGDPSQRIQDRFGRLEEGIDHLAESLRVVAETVQVL